jgi:asparagine synthase (glutamine-hydrolysing)
MTNLFVEIGDWQEPKSRLSFDLEVTGVCLGKKYRVLYKSQSKFKDDSIFYEDDSYILVLGGVILNKSKFCNNNQDWARFMVDKLNDRTFNASISKLRGSFIGCVLNKKTGTWSFFNDHIGSKAIYLYKANDRFVFTSHLNELYQNLNENAVKLHLNEQAAYMLLSYGYLLKNYTLAEEVKRLEPGHIYTLQDHRLKRENYYSLNEIAYINYSETDQLEGIDTHFRSAVDLQFKKDQEYNYDHLVSMSGGLDSRMTSWVAHDLGHVEQLNITFSQANYLDETIAKQIALDLRHQWIFKPLDNGEFLKNNEALIRLNGGQNSYFGISHVNSVLKYLNFDTFGILHSGQLGDVVIGSFGASTSIKTPKSSSKLLQNKVRVDFGEYRSNEILNMYERGFNGANGGLIATQVFTETHSPFYNVDFLNFCFSIPPESREKHKLYRKWITQFYPKAAGYVWEATKQKITDKRYRIGHLELTHKDMKDIVKRKLGLLNEGTDSRHHMNPIDFWMRSNLSISKYFEKFINAHLVLLSPHTELQRDTKTLFETGSAMEQIQVVSLLTAMKEFKLY